MAESKGNKSGNGDDPAESGDVYKDRDKSSDKDVQPRTGGKPGENGERKDD